VPEREERVNKVLYEIHKGYITERTYLESEWDALAEDERLSVLAEHYQCVKTLRAVQRREW